MAHKEFDRFKEVLARFESLLNQVDDTYSPLVLSRIEKEGSIAMRELQFCAPRLWNDFSDVTRTRRNAMARGLVTPPKEKPADVAVSKKETTTKKKTAKKGKK